MSSGIEFGFQLTINKNNEQIIHSGNMELLKGISETGSLNAAAKRLNLSYQSAWNKINELNKLNTNPLVIKQRGGSGGGGAILSDSGTRFLNEYLWVEKQVQLFFNQLNTEIKF